MRVYCIHSRQTSLGHPPVVRLILQIIHPLLLLTEYKFHPLLVKHHPPSEHCAALPAIIHIPSQQWDSQSSLQQDVLITPGPVLHDHPCSSHGHPGTNRSSLLLMVSNPCKLVHEVFKDGPCPYLCHMSLDPPGLLSCRCYGRVDPVSILQHLLAVDPLALHGGLHPRLGHPCWQEHPQVIQVTGVLLIHHNVAQP